jgi:SulP family sulfate permease
LDIFQSKQQTDVAAPSSSYDSTAGDLTIVEPEPIHAPAPGSSVLTQMIRSPPSESVGDDPDHYGGKLRSNDAAGAENPRLLFNDGEEENTSTERTSLLNKTAQPKPFHGYGVADDIESQDLLRGREQGVQPHAPATIRSCLRLIASPKSWDGRAVWQQGVVYPASLLPSVFLGLLLNILDALSYGMILFPLGEPIFSELGSDGISMFYVSTVIAQLVFSCGGSSFRGGIGSEMIEVVPFFHKMAMTILVRVGEDNPKSVLATTILAFSASSVLTGLVFFLMGTCKLGSLIGFFPRHILIGCIGGVGFFLMQTGVEVSARLSGSLELNAPTLQKLFHMDTLLLWMIPLLLAIAFLVLKRFVRSNFLVGGYFIAVGVVFYIVKFGARVSMDTLRSRGWVFDAPSSSNPWYHFYTLYGGYLPAIPVKHELTFCRFFGRRLVRIR